MKTKNYKPAKKQLIVVMMILSFIIGAYAQKSAVILNDDIDLVQLKSLVEILHPTNIYPEEAYLLPSAITVMENIFMDNEAEEELAVEDWMLDENYFMTSPGSNEKYEAEEEKLVVEDWMLDESHFLPDNTNLNSERNLAEDELQVEDWMLDPNHWVLGAE